MRDGTKCSRSPHGKSARVKPTADGACSRAGSSDILEVYRSERSVSSVQLVPARKQASRAAGFALSPVTSGSVSSGVSIGSNPCGAYDSSAALRPRLHTARLDSAAAAPAERGCSPLGN